MQPIPLPDLNATHRLASVLANALTPGAIIFLHGELGAGKTTLVRAMLEALGHGGITKSPTYTLVETYQLPDFTIQHFDLYRLVDAAELEYIGIRDYLTPNTICIFEWANKGQPYVPPADLEITLNFKNHMRAAQIIANSELGLKLLQNIEAEYQ